MCLSVELVPYFLFIILHVFDANIWVLSELGFALLDAYMNVASFISTFFVSLLYLSIFCCCCACRDVFCVFAGGLPINDEYDSVPVFVVVVG